MDIEICALLARGCPFGITDSDACYFGCALHRNEYQYLRGLKAGDRVIKTTRSCMYGREGTVVRSRKSDHLCVRWDRDERDNPPGIMTTSITHGTRRITER